MNCDKEKAREKQKRYYQQNKERVLEKRKQYYLQNREQSLANTKNWRAANPNRVLFLSVKSSAKRKGVPFDLQLEDVIPPTTCPVLGFPLQKKVGSGYFPNSPSVDRIIPALGYIRGNIQIISFRANLMKNDATPEELVLFAKWVQRTYPEMF